MNVTELDAPYCYYAFAIDPRGEVDYLHYGLWYDGVSEIKRAQENLTNLIKSLIPPECKRVLDAGCGLGRTTSDLDKAGYQVTGISPDAQNMHMARGKYRHQKLNLVTESFEGYTDAGLFDLILFQESSQYIPLLTLIQRSVEMVHDRGYVLICDEVRYVDDPGLAFHNRANLIEQAARNGLKLLFSQDLTKEALPTRQFLVDTLREHRLALIAAFEPVRPSVELELDAILNGWDKGTQLYNAGSYGYEVFLFGRDHKP